MYKDTTSPAMSWKSWDCLILRGGPYIINPDQVKRHNSRYKNPGSGFSLPYLIIMLTNTLQV